MEASIAWNPKEPAGPKRAAGSAKEAPRRWLQIRGAFQQLPGAPARAGQKSSACWRADGARDGFTFSQLRGGRSALAKTQAAASPSVPPSMPDSAMK
jgi:hypothetical protein